jgi:regulatory protein
VRGRRTEDPALAAAARILARRDHSTVELARKLSGRGFDDSAVSAALARCRELGYLDDERAGRARLRVLKRRARGVRRMVADLTGRGFDPELVARLTDEAVDEAGERDRARRALAGRWAALCREPDPRRRQARAWRFLQGRGFTPAVIAEVLAEAE